MNIMGSFSVVLDAVVGVIERNMAAFAVGFAAAIILFNAMTGWCLNDDRMVYVVKHQACVSERTFVPAGYVPKEAGK